MSEEPHKQLKDLKKEIGELKDSLAPLEQQKEDAFSKRKTTGSKISELIKQIKPLREERNNLTEEVKALKEERMKLTAQIKEKINEFKKIPVPKQPPQKGPRGPPPGKIRAEIEKLEKVIETQAVTFEKEKALMKEINSLKKQLKNTAETSGAFRESRAISKEIEKLKKQADDLHDKIQEKAKQSQDKHELILKISAEIDELKKQEAELNKQIDETKKELAEKGAPLQEKYQKVKRQKLGEEFEERKKESQQKKKLSELQAQVQEKMKKGEKLTTQDLIILQSVEDGDGEAK